MTRKFYSLVFTFEVLSEEPIPDMSLEDFSYETNEGHMSGAFLTTKRRTLTGKQMAKRLRAQGTDTEFFLLDKAGNEMEEEGYD